MNCLRDTTCKNLYYTYNTFTDFSIEKAWRNKIHLNDKREYFHSLLNEFLHQKYLMTIFSFNTKQEIFKRKINWICLSQFLLNSHYELCKLNFLIRNILKLQCSTTEEYKVKQKMSFSVMQKFYGFYSYIMMHHEKSNESHEKKIKLLCMHLLK